MKTYHLTTKFEAFLFLSVICFLVAGDLLYIATFLNWFLSASSEWLFIGCLYGFMFFAFFNSMLIFIRMEANETI